MNAPHDRNTAGAHKQDAPAPVCAPLSAAAGIEQPTSAGTEDDDALTVAYMVGYAKGKDAADRRDALRYRWLRDPAHSLPDGGEPFLAEEALDAAIDAALASPAGTAQPTSAAPAGVQPVAMDDDPCRATRAGLSGPVPRWETFRPTPPTPASEAVVQDARLWCVNVHGPDDLIARPSRAAALEQANELNVLFGRLDETSTTPEYDPIMRAVVIEWPHSAESHAAALRSLPQQPTGERNGE